MLLTVIIPADTGHSTNEKGSWPPHLCVIKQQALTILKNTFMKRVLKSSGLADSEIMTIQSSLLPKSPRVTSGNRIINLYQMTQAIIFIVAICNALVLSAQPTAFNNISLHCQQKRAYITFSTPNEVNVRYYSVEASNDNNEFSIIGRLPATTNSMHPVQHKYDLSGHDYAYYRVMQLNMNGTMSYSAVVKTPAPARRNKEDVDNIPILIPELAEAK